MCDPLMLHVQQMRRHIVCVRSVMVINIYSSYSYFGLVFLCAYVLVIIRTELFYFPVKLLGL